MTAARNAHQPCHALAVDHLAPVRGRPLTDYEVIVETIAANRLDHDAAPRGILAMDGKWVRGAADAKGNTVQPLKAQRARCSRQRPIWLRLALWVICRRSRNSHSLT